MAIPPVPNESQPDDNGEHQAVATVPPHSFWKRTQTTIMMVAALMISAGQWNDTKDIAITVYESILANFTHNIEYKLIEQIHVGNSLEYVKSLVGEPHVIKRSTIDTEIQYHYYSQEKYDLTLVSQDGQVVGYTLISKQDDFSPPIPFAEKLGSLNLAQANPDPKVYAADTSNLLYFIDSMLLGKQQMFLTQVRGYVEYGANLSGKQSSTPYREQVNNHLINLLELETHSESEQQLLSAVEEARAAIYPNFYAMTKLEPAFIAEALLTRYEYQLFTQS